MGVFKLHYFLLRPVFQIARSQRPPHRTPCWDTDTGEDESMSWEHGSYSLRWLSLNQLEETWWPISPFNMFFFYVPCIPSICEKSLIRKPLAGQDLCCLLRLCEFYDVNHLKKILSYVCHIRLPPGKGNFKGFFQCFRTVTGTSCRIPESPGDYAQQKRGLLSAEPCQLSVWKI